MVAAGLFMSRILLTVFGLFVVVARLSAADWPQFRGAQRDGVAREAGLLADWPKDGPPLAWTIDTLGVGYSGPAVVGNRIYIAGSRGEQELVFALDAATGKETWSAPLGPLFTWKGNEWNVGPNATPTVAGDAAFALGGFGDLV